MKEDIVDKILHSTGYLPPRNEEEMIAFEKIYSQVEVYENFHVDVDSIINGSCHRVSMPKHGSSDGNITAEDLRMAARNFSRMPQDVVDKIKKQHQNDAD